VKIFLGRKMKFLTNKELYNPLLMIFNKEIANNSSVCENSTSISALCSENAPEMENEYPVTPLLSLTAGVM
jgi:hypothetical protein